MSINCMDVVRNESWYGKLTDKDIEIFNISYNITEKYGDTEDFVIDLEDVVEWTGYSDKVHLKHQVLVKNFKEGIDYKIVTQSSDEVLLSKKREQKLREENRGGSNKQTILLTVDCAMEICLLVNTIRGKQVRHYYMKIEKIMKNDIKLKLEEQQNQMSDQKRIIDEKQKILNDKQEELRIMKEKEKEESRKKFMYVLRTIYDKYDNVITKFGIACNKDERLLAHKTTNARSEFAWTYEFKTNNVQFVETTLKHLLSEYVIAKSKNEKQIHGCECVSIIDEKLVMICKFFTELLDVDVSTEDKLNEYIKYIHQHVSLNENIIIKNKEKKDESRVFTNKHFILKDYEQYIEKYFEYDEKAVIKRTSAYEYLIHKFKKNKTRYTIFRCK